MEQLQQFIFDMLDKKYIDVSKKIDLITKYKDNVQLLAVDEAIKGYEENLKKVHQKVIGENILNSICFWWKQSM